MADDGDLAAFVREHVRSVWAVELLLLLKRAPDRAWPPEALTAELRALAEQLMVREAAPSIVAAPGQDLPRYAADLLARFANPALNHRLIQIAMDGSQKLPQRWLETLAANARVGLPCPAIRAGLGAWLAHLRGANGPVEDPQADRLASALAAGTDPVKSLFGPRGVLASDWTPTDADCAAIAGLGS